MKTFCFALFTFDRLPMLVIEMMVLSELFVFFFTFYCLARNRVTHPFSILPASLSSLPLKTLAALTHFPKDDVRVPHTDFQGNIDLSSASKLIMHSLEWQGSNTELRLPRPKPLFYIRCLKKAANPGGRACDLQSANEEPWLAS